jgi:hypothetical protein
MAWDHQINSLLSSLAKQNKTEAKTYGRAAAATYGEAETLKAEQRRKSPQHSRKKERGDDIWSGLQMSPPGDIVAHAREATDALGKDSKAPIHLLRAAVKEAEAHNVVRTNYFNEEYFHPFTRANTNASKSGMKMCVCKCKSM